MGRLQGLWPVGATKREERIDLVPSCGELRVCSEKAVITNGSSQTMRNMKIVCDVWCFSLCCSKVESGKSYLFGTSKVVLREEGKTIKFLEALWCLFFLKKWM